MKRYLLILLISLCSTSPAWAVGSVDLDSGEYLDAGVAANTAHGSQLSLAIMVNLDSCTPGATQALMARLVSDASSGYEFDVNDTTCTLSIWSEANDLINGTATTALTAGSWYGVGVTVNGSGGGAAVHFVRYNPSTGALATEDTSIFWAATPSGVQKLTFGGKWLGALNFPTAGLLAKALITNRATVLTDAEMINWFCNSAAPAGTDGAWLLNESATPSLDTSGNSYSATWTGTVTAGSAPTACPSVSAKRRASGQ